MILYHFVESFNREWVLNFVKRLSASIERIVWSFLFHFADGLSHICGTLLASLG